MLRKAKTMIFGEAKLNGPLIPETLLQELGQGHPHTPDFHELELREGVLVFVADEMLPQGRAHNLVNNEHSMKLWTAYTNQEFAMFRKVLGKRSYPVIMRPTEEFSGVLSRAETAPVKGLVYLLKPKQIIELDNYKENGVVFDRVRVHLDIPYREVHESSRTILNQISEDQGTTKVVQVVEKYNVVDGEVKHNKSLSVFTYLGRPEYFFWHGYADKQFAPLRPKKTSDRNRKPFFQYNPLNDNK